MLERVLECVSEGAQHWALAHSLRVICFSVETQTERTDLWTQGSGEEGEGGMYGDSTMEIYITICEIDSHGNLLV